MLLRTSIKQDFATSDKAIVDETYPKIDWKEKLTKAKYKRVEEVQLTIFIKFLSKFICKYIFSAYICIRIIDNH